MDLNAQDDNGEPWDFLKKRSRIKAMELLRTTQPKLLVGSPPFTMYSNMQDVIKDKMNPVERGARHKDADMLLKFAVDVHTEQDDNGRSFLLEHTPPSSVC